MSAGFHRYKLIVYPEGVLVAGPVVTAEDFEKICRAAEVLDPSWTMLDGSGIARRADGRIAIGSRESLAAWRRRLGLAGEAAP